MRCLQETEGNYLISTLCSINSALSETETGAFLSVFQLCQSLLNNNKFIRYGSFIGCSLPDSPVFLDSQLRQTGSFFPIVIMNINTQVMYYTSSSNICSISLDITSNHLICRFQNGYGG